MTNTLLANLALNYAKLQKIDNINDSNERAGYIKQILPEVLKQQLGEHYWGFARKTTEMLIVSETFENWDYVHDIPDDLVRPEKFYPSGYDYQLHFLTAEQYTIFENDLTADRAFGRIASNQENLSVVYTKYISVIPLFPNYFADAMAYLLGYYLATRFGGSERAAWCYQMWGTDRLPNAIGKDWDVERHNVQGIPTLTTDDIVEPWNYR